MWLLAVHQVMCRAFVCQMCEREGGFQSDRAIPSRGTDGERKATERFLICLRSHRKLKGWRCLHLTAPHLAPVRSHLCYFLLLHKSQLHM